MIGEPRVLSRHTGGPLRRCDVRAWNLNAWCTLAGNPFVGPVGLMPNHPDSEVAVVEFGPIQLPDGADSITFFLESTDTHEHDHTLGIELAVVDRSERALAVGRAALAQGGADVSTLTFEDVGRHGVSLRMAVGFDAFTGGPHYGKVWLSYLLAYPGNELVDLFNAAGSDKGTRKRVGAGAAPHCYAVDYFELFRHLRERPFRLLEIGLQSNEGTDYRPSDAPSLSVWHDFFPQAQIFGYDINDFSFFQQERTLTVQGDQSSRENLERFAREHAGDGFGLVLDDGSHASSHQQISLGSLFRWVEPGGLYVIEDLHWQPFPEAPTTLEVLRDFVESGRLRTPFLDEEEVLYLEEAIDRLEIHRPNDSEFAVIHKRDA